MLLRKITVDKHRDIVLCNRYRYPCLEEKRYFSGKLKTTCKSSLMDVLSSITYNEKVEGIAMPRWLYGLLIFAVLAPILELFSLPPLVIFVVAALGILPLAALIGQSVEKIAEHTGE